MKELQTKYKNDELIDLKTEGLRVDNLYKEKMMENEVKAGKKLDLEIRKIELEVEKFHKELYPQEYI